MTGRDRTGGLGKMACEECTDTASSVSRVLVFVTRPYDDAEHPDQALVFVEEGMPSVRVFLDVMLDVVPLKRAFQPCRPALYRPVAAGDGKPVRADP